MLSIWWNCKGTLHYDVLLPVYRLILSSTVNNSAIGASNLEYSARIGQQKRCCFPSWQRQTTHIFDDPKQKFIELGLEVLYRRITICLVPCKTSLIEKNSNKKGAIKISWLGFLFRNLRNSKLMEKWNNSKGGKTSSIRIAHIKLIWNIRKLRTVATSDLSRVPNLSTDRGPNRPEPTRSEYERVGRDSGDKLRF